MNNSSAVRMRLPALTLFDRIHRNLLCADAKWHSRTAIVNARDDWCHFLVVNKPQSKWYCRLPLCADFKLATAIRAEDRSSVIFSKANTIN